MTDLPTTFALAGVFLPALLLLVVVVLGIIHVVLTAIYGPEHRR